MLVALMLWLPRGLQLPLCPISVIDELRLISVAASLPPTYAGPLAARPDPEQGRRRQRPDLGGPHRRTQPEKVNLWSQLFFQGSGSSEADCRRVVLSLLSGDSGAFRQKNLSRATSFRADLIISVILSNPSVLRITSRSVSGQKYTKKRNWYCNRPDGEQ